jgi:DNA-binding beta-propeller fold protein YncE
MMTTKLAITKFRLLLSAALLLFAAGCALPKQDLIPMYWPDPPEKTRIKYVRSFRSVEDLNPQTSMMEFVVGKKAQVGLWQPMGLAVSEDGQRVYVVDFAWSNVLVFDYENRTLNMIGSARFPLGQPIGVALDRRENVYVSDTAAKSVKVFEKSGSFLRAIGKDILIRPTGLAVDKQRGLLYVVDTGHNEAKAHQIQVFELDGSHIRTIGKRGSDDGDFNFPTQATVDSEGRLYVVDSANSRIQVFDPEGKFVQKFGRAGNQVGDFGRPKDVALDTFGNIYVVDSHWSIVEIFNAKGQLLMHFGGRGDYPGRMNNPTGIAIDNNNRIYVSNYLNRRVDMYQLVNTTAEDSWIQPEAGQNKVANTK